MARVPPVDSVLVTMGIPEQIVPSTSLAQGASISAAPTGTARLVAIAHASPVIAARTARMELQHAPMTAMVMGCAHHRLNASATRDGQVRVVIRSSCSLNRNAHIIAVAMANVRLGLAAIARRDGSEQHVLPALQCGGRRRNLDRRSEQSCCSWPARSVNRQINQSSWLK